MMHQMYNVERDRCYYFISVYLLIQFIQNLLENIKLKNIIRYHKQKIMENKKDKSIFVEEKNAHFNAFSASRSQESGGNGKS